jgi:GNAT superfamily N-acetyltransferase
MIRLADTADLSALTSLIERYWELEGIKCFDAGRISALVTNLLHAPDRGQIWIAQKGGRPVGYLLAVYLFSLEHGGLMAEIDELFVMPEKRSLKIGTALLDTASQAMTQEGITHLQLQLSTQNLNAKRFYERHGFRSISGRDVLSKILIGSA